MPDPVLERYKAALKAGHVAVLRGRAEEAMARYREAAEAAPDRALPFSSLGGVLARLGRFEDAQAAYAHALDLGSADEGTLGGLAEVFQALDRRADAAATLDRLADLQAGTARLPEALETLHRADALDGRPDRKRRIAALASSSGAKPIAKPKPKPTPAVQAKKTERAAKPARVPRQSAATVAEKPPAPPRPTPIRKEAAPRPSRPSRPAAEGASAPARPARPPRRPRTETPGGAKARVTIRDTAKPPRATRSAPPPTVAMAATPSLAVPEVLAEVVVAEPITVPESAVAPEPVAALGPSVELAIPTAEAALEPEPEIAPQRETEAALLPETAPEPEPVPEPLAVDVAAAPSMESPPAPALAVPPSEPLPDGEPLIEQAEAAAEEGRTEDAQAAFAAAAVAYLAAGQTDAAIDACQRGLLLGPSSPPLQLQLTRVYLALGWATRAVTKLVLLDRLLEIDGDRNWRRELAALAAASLSDGSDLPATAPTGPERGSQGP